MAGFTPVNVRSNTSIKGAQCKVESRQTSDALTGTPDTPSGLDSHSPDPDAGDAADNEASMLYGSTENATKSTLNHFSSNATTPADSPVTSRASTSPPSPGTESKPPTLHSMPKPRAKPARVAKKSRKKHATSAVVTSLLVKPQSQAHVTAFNNLSSHHNSFLYAQQRNRANPPLDPGTLKLPFSTRLMREQGISPRPEHSRPFGLECVPTVSPTREEFADPHAFLASIRDLGRRYGAVKVVPPESWRPQLSLESEFFWFRSNRQGLGCRLSSVQMREYFRKLVYRANRVKGAPIVKKPSIDKRPLDLFLLHGCVQLRGGFVAVCKNKLWAQVGRELGYSGRVLTSLSSSLKNVYQRVLVPLDEYLEKENVSVFSNGSYVDVSDLPEIPEEDKDKDEEVVQAPSVSQTSASYVDGVDQSFPHLKPNTDTPSIPVDPTLPPFDNWHHGMAVVEGPADEFKDVPTYTLRQFQQKARQFEAQYFGDKLRSDDETADEYNDPSSDASFSKHSEDEIERAFWELLNNKDRFVEVECGSRVSTRVQQSPFPVPERDTGNSSMYEPWNLHTLPYTQGSLLRHLDVEVPTLASPTIDIGMVFSCALWTFEDYYTHAVRFHHFGDTKTFYSVPEADADKLRQLLKGNARDGDGPLHSSAFLSPAELQANGIKCYALDQRAGEITITFPKAYHASLDHGFNVVEAVNFVSAGDWFAYGQECVELYAQNAIQPPFSLDRLVLNLASEELTVDSSKQVLAIAEKIHDREMQLRKRARQKFSAVKEKVEDAGFHEKWCAHTARSLYLSYLRNSDVEVSIEWALDHDQDVAGLELVLAMSDQELSKICDQLRERAHMPEKWLAKVHSSLSAESKLPLKQLRSLAAEGEKIPYVMKDLANLKQFIVEAEAWVESVQRVLTRKSKRKEVKDEVKGEDIEMENGGGDINSDAMSASEFQSLVTQSFHLPFACPEASQLQDRALEINNFRRRVDELIQEVAQNGKPRSLVEYSELLDLGLSFRVDLVEVTALIQLHDCLKWYDKADVELRAQSMGIDDLYELISAGAALKLTEMDQVMARVQARYAAVLSAEQRARDIFAQGCSIGTLDQLIDYVQKVPLSAALAEALSSTKARYHKLYGIRQRILSAQQAGGDSTSRPSYLDAKELFEEVRELPCQLDITSIERDLRQTEAWMRQGKRLFGKGNAAFHVLASHVEYVLQRTTTALAVDDQFQNDTISSGEMSAAVAASADINSSERFCVCRAAESGVMIECDNCHTWYHTKCVKANRSRPKSENYVCYICDWRVEPPHDTVRATETELRAWRDEATQLRLRPREIDNIDAVLSVVEQFRVFLRTRVLPKFEANFPGTLLPQWITEMRFYLRKLEGSEVLLPDEINFLRMKLHAVMPISEQAPIPVELRQPRRQAKGSVEIAASPKNSLAHGNLEGNSPQVLPQAPAHLQQLGYQLTPMMQSQAPSIQPSTPALVSAEFNGLQPPAPNLPSSADPNQST